MRTTQASLGNLARYSAVEPVSTYMARGNFEPLRGQLLPLIYVQAARVPLSLTALDNLSLQCSAFFYCGTMTIWRPLYRMPTLFLSHASRDDGLARDLQGWLTSQGFDDLFID